MVGMAPRRESPTAAPARCTAGGWPRPDGALYGDDMSQFEAPADESPKFGSPTHGTSKFGGPVRRGLFDGLRHHCHSRMDV